MRKFVSATMAALIGISPLSSAALAQSKPHTAKKVERQVQPKREQWKKGGRYKGRGAAVTNYSRYKLKTPPKGHRWVRDGNDFLLVATATGIIAAIATAGR